MEKIEQKSLDWCLRKSYQNVIQNVFCNCFGRRKSTASRNDFRLFWFGQIFVGESRCIWKSMRWLSIKYIFAWKFWLHSPYLYLPAMRVSPISLYSKLPLQSFRQVLAMRISPLHTHRNRKYRVVKPVNR